MSSPSDGGQDSSTVAGSPPRSKPRACRPGGALENPRELGAAFPAAGFGTGPGHPRPAVVRPSRARPWHSPVAEQGALARILIGVGPGLPRPRQRGRGGSTGGAGRSPSTPTGLRRVVPRPTPQPTRKSSEGTPRGKPPAGARPASRHRGVDRGRAGARDDRGRLSRGPPGLAGKVLGSPAEETVPVPAAHTRRTGPYEPGGA